MRTLMLLAGLTLLLAVPATASARHHGSRSTEAVLYPVGDSGVGGMVTVQTQGHGAAIDVHATGLQPGVRYTSLTYSNPTCQLESYGTEDTIGGGPYTADAMGTGVTHGMTTDKVRQIHSISVRLTSSFQLLACAAIG